MTPRESYLADFNDRLNLGVMTNYEIMHEMQSVSSAMLQLAMLATSVNPLKQARQQLDGLKDTASELSREIERLKVASAP